MKKFLLSILTVLVWAGTSYAVINTATKAGNWSDTTVWDLGHVPTEGEDVALASYIVVWDVATIQRIPATGSLGTITAATTGTITMDISNAACLTSGTCQINFTTAAAGTEHLFQIITTATTNDVTFNGTSITASVATSSKNGIHHIIGGGAKAIVNANLIGSSGSTGVGLRIGVAGALATINGNITGGGSGVAYGVSNAGSSTSIITINSGTITGGSWSTATGVFNQSGSAAAVVVSAGVKLVNSTQASAMGGSFTWNAAANDYWKIGTLYVGKAPAAAVVGVGTSVLNNSTGAYDAGTLAAGGGGAWVF